MYFKKYKNLRLNLFLKVIFLLLGLNLNQINQHSFDYFKGTKK